MGFQAFLLIEIDIKRDKFSLKTDLKNRPIFIRKQSECRVPANNGHSARTKTAAIKTASTML